MDEFTRLTAGEKLVYFTRFMIDFNQLLGIEKAGALLPCKPRVRVEDLCSCKGAESAGVHYTCQVTSKRATQKIGVHKSFLSVRSTQVNIWRWDQRNIKWNACKGQGTECYYFDHRFM